MAGETSPLGSGIVAHAVLCKTDDYYDQGHVYALYLLESDAQKAREAFLGMQVESVGKIEETAVVRMLVRATFTPPIKIARKEIF